MVPRNDMDVELWDNIADASDIHLVTSKVCRDKLCQSANVLHELPVRFIGDVVQRCVRCFGHDDEPSNFRVFVEQ